MENETKVQKKKWYKKIKYWVLIILGAFIGICVLAIIASQGMPIIKDVPKEVKQAEIELSGFGVDANATVKTYLNGNFFSEVNANEKGKFKFSILLSEGINTVYVEAIHENKIEKSAEEKITYINQEKIDAQNKAEEENKAKEQEAQQKIEDDAKLVNQQKADEEDRVLAQQKSDEDAKKQEEEKKQEVSQAEHPSEEDQIKQLVSKQLEGKNNNGKDRIIKIKVVEQIDGGWGVFTEYNADDASTTNLTKKGIYLDMSKIYASLYTSGKDIQNASVSAYFPVVDKYGSTSDEVVYKTMLEKAEADKVNWDIDSSYLGLEILPKVWEITWALPELR